MTSRKNQGRLISPRPAGSSVQRVLADHAAQYQLLMDKYAVLELPGDT